MRRRGLLAAVFLATSLLTFVLPTRGAEPTPLPAEPGARVLDGEAVAATVGDIDGDGSRELIRVVRSETNPGTLAVDAWKVDGAGAWTHFAQVPLRFEASVDRKLTGLPRPDAEGMLPVQFGDPVQLLRVRGPRSASGLGILDETVVVATIGEGADEERTPLCCLTLWQLRTATGSTLPTVSLDLLAATGRSASWVVAANLDSEVSDPYGDSVLTSTDEILVGADEPDSTDSLIVLGWDGSGAFGEIARRSYSAESILLTWEAPSLARYSPGCAGIGRQPEVAVLSPPSRDSADGRITTLRRVGSSLVEDEQHFEYVNADALDEARPTLRNGARVLVEFQGTTWIGWPWPSPPPGGPVFGLLSPQAAIGGTRDAPLLLVGRTLLPVTELFDECAYPFLGVPGTTSARRFTPWLPGDPRLGSLEAYVGELPTKAEWGDSVIFLAGSVLTIAGDGSLRLDRGATMPGMSPLGRMGPASELHDAGNLIALAEANPFPADGRGFDIDGYVAPPPSRTSVAAVSQVLESEADDGTLRPAIFGAVPDPGQAPDELITGPAGFRAEVEVPPGSRLFVAPLGEGFAVNPTWKGRTDDGHAVLPVAVPAGRNTFNVRAFVVTPAGHGYTVAWHVTVLSEPPPIEVEAEWASLGFDVPLRGSTDPQATVLVDGTAVAVAADGTFTTYVAAPPWPTAVTVEAVDLAGNRTTVQLSVVGLLDYRQLPWVPIIVALTVVAAAGLFLLAPRLRPPSVTPHPDDGTLEDIDER